MARKQETPASTADAKNPVSTVDSTDGPPEGDSLLSPAAAPPPASGDPGVSGDSGAPATARAPAEGSGVCRHKDKQSLALARMSSRAIRVLAPASPLLTLRYPKTPVRPLQPWLIAAPALISWHKRARPTLTLRLFRFIRCGLTWMKASFVVVAGLLIRSRAGMRRNWCSGIWHRSNR